jgi:hypothetical protein
VPARILSRAKWQYKLYTLSPWKAPATEEETILRVPSRRADALDRACSKGGFIDIAPQRQYKELGSGKIIFMYCNVQNYMLTFALETY